MATWFLGRSKVTPERRFHPFRYGLPSAVGSLLPYQLLTTTLCLFVCFALAIPAAGPASAQSKDARLRDAKERKKSTREQAHKVKQQQQQLTGDLEKLNADRVRLNTELKDAASKAQRIEARMSVAEAELTKLREQEREQRQKLARQNASIAKLLGAMQRMGRNPPPVIITQRSDALKMVRSAMLLGRAFPEFREKAAALTKDLNALVAVMNRQRQENAKLELEKQQHDDNRIRLDGLIASKKQLILSRNKEMTELGKIAALLEKRETSLSRLIEELDKAVARKTGLGKYQQKIARATIPPASTILPPETPSLPNPETKSAAITPSTIGPSAIELAPSSSGLGVNPGRLAPSIPFHKARAQLPLPAYGKQLIRFGERTTQGGRSKGLVIRTRAGGQITSPCDGWVVYAGAFRSYGQLLIINAGGGYHVLLANLSRLDVQLGQFVLAAEPVGTMAGAERQRGKSRDPVLYVEFRKNGKPIDPSPWWAKGQKRVQG